MKYKGARNGGALPSPDTLDGREAKKQERTEETSVARPAATATSKSAFFLFNSQPQQLAEGKASATPTTASKPLNALNAAPANPALSTNVFGSPATWLSAFGPASKPSNVFNVTQQQNLPEGKAPVMPTTVSKPSKAFDAAPANPTPSTNVFVSEMSKLVNAHTLSNQKIDEWRAQFAELDARLNKLVKLDKLDDLQAGAHSVTRCQHLICQHLIHPLSRKGKLLRYQL